VPPPETDPRGEVGADDKRVTVIGYEGAEHVMQTAAVVSDRSRG
jgi:hypothetical protein